MEKSKILNATIYKNCETDRFTENFLCDEIYDNLRVLAFFYPFSDCLKSLFEKGMFIKSNPKAFPHVMKYLFSICDASEFKKKFCWPIYNKAAEATFRNATLEFLNKLNTKYNLGFGELKHKVVVFPGGIEFMRIIFELTKLTMRITLKRNNRSDDVNQSAVSVGTANEKLHEIQTFYDQAAVYCKKLEKQSAELKEKTLKIRITLDKLIENTSITSKNILHQNFNGNWKHVQNDIAENGIKPDLKHLKSFRLNCERLESKIGELFKKQTLTIDTGGLDRFTSGIEKLYPLQYRKLDKGIANHQFNLDQMLIAFGLALPLMMNQIQSYKPPNMDVLRYEANGIGKLTLSTKAIFQKVIVFDMQMHSIIEHFDKIAEPKAIQDKVTHNMKTMILSTPPISYNALKRTENANVCSKRISLMGSQFLPRNIPSNLSRRPLNSILENTMSRIDIKPNINTFLSPNQNANLPRNKLDPLNMLKTIEKKDKFRQPNNRPKISEYQLKFAQNQKPNETIPTVLQPPKFSSTFIQQNRNNESGNRIGGDDTVNQISLNHTSSSLGNANNSNISINIIKRRHSLMQHFSSFDGCEMNTQYVNRSPSGRIEALIKTEECSKNISHFKSSVILNECKVKEENRSPEVQTKSLKPTIGQIENTNNIENNQNANNIRKFNLFNLIDEDDESILNISDSILTSVMDCSQIG